MQARDICAHLQTQLDQGIAPFEKEVVVRLAGRDYTIHGLDASTSALVLEGGEWETSHVSPSSIGVDEARRFSPDPRP